MIPKHCIHGFIDPAKCIQCTYVPPKNPPPGQLGHVVHDPEPLPLAAEFIAQRARHRARRRNNV